jgi:hypothetical protein
LQCLLERPTAGNRFGIILSESNEDADAPHSLRLRAGTLARIKRALDTKSKETAREFVAEAVERELKRRESVKAKRGRI